MFQQKLLLLPVLIAASGWQTASAQCNPSLSACTLRVPTDPVCMIPDTNEMPPAPVNEPYERSIHFIFENSITVSSNPQTGDSLPFPITATLDYMVFDSIGSLPPGITYEMYSGNPADPPGKFSSFSGNKAHGCIYLHGLPTQANTSATNGAIIYMKPHGCVLGGVLCGDFAWQVTYRVPIESALAAGSLQKKYELNILPHFSAGKIRIEFDSDAFFHSEIFITDMTGKEIFAAAVSVSEGSNRISIDFSGTPGFYILRIKTSDGIIAKRFVW